VKKIDQNSVLLIMDLRDARKKDFLLSNITTENKERERIRAGSHNHKNDRSVSLVYHFMKDGTRHRLCKKFFTRSLAIRHSPITEAVRGCGEVGQFEWEDKCRKQRARVVNIAIKVSLSLVSAILLEYRHEYCQYF